jgi:putative membrane protein
MNIIVTVLTALVVLEFIVIFALETVQTASQKTADTFGIPIEELAKPHLNSALKNQGVYNLCIAGLLVVGLVAGDTLLVASALVMIVIVAAYGSLTVQPAIILKQGGLPILALIAMAATGALF